MFPPRGCIIPFESATNGPASHIQMDRVSYQLPSPAAIMQYWTGSCRIGNRQRPRHNKMEMHYDIRVANSIYAFGGHHFSAICQLELTRDSSGSALLAYIYLYHAPFDSLFFKRNSQEWVAAVINMSPVEKWIRYLFIFFPFFNAVTMSILCTSFERWLWFKEN